MVCIAKIDSDKCLICNDNSRDTLNLECLRRRLQNTFYIYIFMCIDNFCKIPIDCETTENLVQPLQSGNDTKDRQMAKEASSESLLHDFIFAPDALPINIQRIN